MGRTNLNRKAYSILTVLFVGLLLFSACGTGSDTTNDQGVVVDNTAGTADDNAAIVDTPSADAQATDEALTPEEMADEVVQDDETASETMTDTGTMSESATMTDSATMTETGTIDVITETQVITQTDVVTDIQVMTDTEVTVGDEVTTETDSTQSGAVMTDTTGAEPAATATPMPEGETQATPEASTAAAGSAAQQTAGNITGISGADGVLVHGATLLDYNFENLTGDVSGDLEDLLIDTSTGDVLLTSIEYGGFLDLGDKDIVVPLSAFKVGPQGQLVLNFDEQTLQDFPDLGNNWPDITNSAWDDNVNQFWQNAGFDTGFTFDQTNTDGVMWLSDLTGLPLMTQDGGQGNIRDVLVDLGNSAIKFAVVDFGAVTTATANNGLYILPFKALNLQNGTNQAAFDDHVNMDLLNAGPQYDQTLYANGEQLSPETAQQVDNYWRDQGIEID